MNCPSRTDDVPEHDGYNQSPSALAADLTTRQDLNGIVNLRTDQDFGQEAEDGRTERPMAGFTHCKQVEHFHKPPSFGDDCNQGNKQYYQPSLAAIRACMSYSIAEVVFSLCVFALLVNSAILIVAGASLSQSATAESGNLFAIYALLSKTLAPAAGTVFALALLLSGTSAGIVCTMAGQILSEGALNWKVAPWIRRSVTRSISIIPSIIIAGAVGKDGLSAALNATQVALSIALPFVSAPLIYFTCRNKYMVVGGINAARPEHSEQRLEMEQMDDFVTKMRNHWILSGFAIAIWLVIAVMNVALLVLLGLGKA
ncbi:hypothetical protein P7C71_g3126, partial [Lecanoromycetidae sp. Uapishka_2]